jgi:uncharacterized iron-regulated membrane protein
MTRLLFFLHRWLGVALAAFMLLWFVTGLVIVYSSYMYQNRTQQLAHAEPLRLEAGWLGFGEAWERSAGERAEAFGGKAAGGEKDAEIGIVEARLLRQGGQPVWLAEDTQRRFYAISAENGRLWQASSDHALKIAADWLDKERGASPADSLSPQYLETLDKPVILRGQEALAPFHRIALQDILGSELLVSARTGEVVHVSNGLERASYWAGNWLHMFRFLDLAGWGGARNDVLFWTITLSLAACITGLIVGWLRWRPGWFGKDTYSQGRVHPYRAFWLRWHFWTGLIGGVMATLWALSGVFSTLQGQLFSPAAPSRNALQQYYGAGIPSEIQAWKPDPSTPIAGDIVQLGWRRLGEEAVLLAYKPDGERILVESAPFTRAGLNTAVERLTNTDASVEKQAELITEYDRYYYPRHRRGAYDRPLPALRVQLNDSARTRVYLDPLDGRLLLRDDNSRRLYRWLFSAVHRWDIPVLYQRPLWDAWMLLWIVLGLVLGTSSVVLGVKRLKLTFRRKTRPSAPNDKIISPEPASQQSA